MTQRHQGRLGACIISAVLTAWTTGCRNQSSETTTSSSPNVAVEVKTPTTLPSAPAGVRVYVGTYTGPKSQGIYQFAFDSSSGALTSEGVAAETTNPSFLTLHPNHKWLYVDNELSEFDGKKGGAVTGFSIDPASGKLTALNEKFSGGESPCFVAIDPPGRHALVANYGGGSVEVLPIDSEGKLGDPTAFVQHKARKPLNLPATTEATSQPAEKERHANAHWIDIDPSGQFAIACDLGLDQVLVYNYDNVQGTLSPHDPPAATLPEKTGPRHLVFHPNHRFAYLIGELDGSLTVFAWDAALGVLRQIQRLSALPEGYVGRNNSAEIVFHPNGKFLYASNRGPDDIAIFAVDANTGKVTLAGRSKTGGKEPRNFTIDPSGKFLVVANQNTNNLAEFRIDGKSGALTPSGVDVPVQAPVCVLFVPLSK